MSNNLGIDLYLNNGDFEFNTSGDYFTTLDYAINNPSEELFDGYINYRESIARIINEIAGVYSPFYVDFGAGAKLLVSSIIVSEFESFKERATQQIISDGRTSSIDQFYYEEIPDQNTVNVFLYLTAVGQNEPTPLIFPFNLY
jgi:hypothetical protein